MQETSSVIPICLQAFITKISLSSNFKARIYMSVRAEVHVRKSSDHQFGH